MRTTRADEAIDLPAGLDRGRHLDRHRHSLWPRRVGLALLTALCVLGLLDVFGQRSTVTRADSPAASLTVDSPQRLRSGLVFTTDMVVAAHRTLHDARVTLSPGWTRGMTLNGLAPQPQNQDSGTDGLVLDFGELDAGRTLEIWISWMVNPTTVGARDNDVTLADGTTQVLSVPRGLWVFP